MYFNAMSPFDTLQAHVKNFGVKKVTNVVMTDPRFPIWSASSKPGSHHYGDGGLVQHTSEVVELCLTTNLYFKKFIPAKAVDDRVLFLAALFHDCGKMWDYVRSDDEKTPWSGSTHKREIHHISRSGQTWCEAASLYPTTDDGKVVLPKQDIWHAILAHHGCRDWGSPVSPHSRVAWLLHYCDGISARMDDCYTHDRID